MSKEQKRREYLEKFKRTFIGKDKTSDESRGDESEERFRAMVERLNQEGKLPWFRGIAKSSVHEDWIKRIDFWIRVVSESENGTMEFSIPFQIKSSLTGAEGFKKRHPDSTIHIIVMNVSMNEDWLLELLNDAYLEEVRKRS